MYLYLRSYKINSISSSLTSSKRQKKKRRKKITILIIRSFLDISTIIPSGAFLFNVIPTDTDKPVRSTFPCVPFPAVLQQPPLYETSIIYGGSVRGVREIVRNIPLSPDEELVCDRIGGVTRGREGRRGGGRPLETPCLWKGKEYARRMAFRMGHTASGRMRSYVVTAPF